MDKTPTEIAPRQRRISGSETRQRRSVLTVRLTDDEYATVSAAAEEAGLTVAAFLRTKALGAPGLRAARRPVPHRVELAKMLGEVGKLGSNLNQLAKAFNTDATAPEAARVAAVQAEVAAMRDELMIALGRGDQGR